MWVKVLTFWCVIINSCSLIGGVGERCTSSTVVDSVCVLITDCAVAIRSLRSKGRHHFPRCGFEGMTEVVCCPISMATRGTFENNQRIAEMECQKIINTMSPPGGHRIMGGEKAEIGEFPHMVAIGYKISGLYQFRCGGSLISSAHVLTAAHCVCRFEGEQPSIVRVGTVDISENTFNENTDIGIAEYYIHPLYTNRMNYHDIAILRLSNYVHFTRNVFPACLYTSQHDPTTPLIVTGWGRYDIKKSSTSNELLLANVNIVPLKKCNMKYGDLESRKLPHGITNLQVCAHDPMGISDSCQGDSGGPLQGLTGQDGYYRVVGITSFGRGCSSSIPGVYTKVSQYVDWIESVVWPN